MATCPRCGKSADETKLAACPNCSTPLKAPSAAAPSLSGTSALPNGAAPAQRYSLTGEPIGETPAPQGAAPQPAAPAGSAIRYSLSGEPVEEAAPAPPGYMGAPLPSQGGPGAARPTPPPAQPPRRSADYSTAPEVQSGEKKVFYGAAAVGAVLLILLVIGGVSLYSRYAKQQAAYEYDTHLHISTPKDAAMEVINSFKDQAWSRLYFLCDFSDEKIKKRTHSLEFSQAIRQRTGYVEVGRVLQTLADLKIGEFTPHGDKADVPYTGRITQNGVAKPLHGVIHLIDEGDGWYLDMSSVSYNHPTIEDKVEVARVLGDIYGANGTSSEPAPAASPRGGYSAPPQSPASYGGNQSALPQYNSPPPPQYGQPTTSGAPTNGADPSGGGGSYNPPAGSPQGAGGDQGGGYGQGGSPGGSNPPPDSGSPSNTNGNPANGNPGTQGGAPGSGGEASPPQGSPGNGAPGQGQ